MPYTISEAAARMHLSAPTLRYYDKEGLLPFVDRSASGVRVFKESDFEWLRLIECLKATGMPIRDIKQFIDWCLEGDATLPQRRDMFRERRRAVLASTRSILHERDGFTGCKGCRRAGAEGRFGQRRWNFFRAARGRLQTGT